MKSDKEIAEDLVLEYGKRCEAQAPAQLLVDKFAAVLAQVRQETVRGCGEAFRDWKRYLAPACNSGCECPCHDSYPELKAAILRVGQPAEPVSPFGCQCWHQRTDKDGEQWWFRGKPETVGIEMQYDAQFCEVCGKKRVEVTP